MPMVRKVYVLKKDVQNVDKRPRKGPFRDMPDEFEEGDVFVHEVVVPKRGKPYDALLYLDDDDMPLFPFERGSPMYENLFRHLRRAKPGMARLLHEYNVYAPQSLPEIIERLIDTGLVTLAQLEATIIAHRQSYDYDMLDDDDVIALPKPGRSKLDDDDGGTDPTRKDFDPREDGYADPDYDEDDEDDEMDAEDGLEETFKTWYGSLQEIVTKTLKREHAVPEPYAREGFEAGETPDEFAAAYIDEHNLSPDPKVKPKKAKRKAKRKGIEALADKVYDALSQTPGKTRRIETLREMVGAKAGADVYRAMDLLSKQGRIDDKGRAVIKEG